MRIISGEFKGKILISPDNNEIRPTSDRGKEVIFDTLSRRIVLVRDHMGQKPLYYHYNKNEIVCASELRALLSIKNFRWKLNKKAIARYLANACFMGEETPLLEVLKVPPGHYLTIEPDKEIFLYSDKLL